MSARTPVAGLGPWLRTTAVSRTAAPAKTDAGFALAATWRAEYGPMVTATVAWLSVGSDSGSLAVAAAWFIRVCSAAAGSARARTSKNLKSNAAKLGTSQATACPTAVQSGAATSVRPGGSVSVSSTPVAVSGPALRTLSRKTGSLPTASGPVPSVRVLVTSRSTSATADADAAPRAASAMPRSTRDLLSVRIRRTLHHLWPGSSLAGRGVREAQRLADAEAAVAGDRPQAAVLVAAVDPALAPAVRAGRPDRGRGRSLGGSGSAGARPAMSASASRPAKYRCRAAW